MKKALSIAGSDSGGGAGIQADLKTMIVHGVFGMSAITALTAQNTTGVYAISEVTPEFLAQQLDAVFSDLRPDAVKIGMVPTPALMETIADRLIFWQAENIVLDPVMVATSGSRLMESAAVTTLKRRLLPLCSLATPNIPEAEALTGREIHGESDMIAAATAIADECGCAVLLKGGHSVCDADDLLVKDGKATWFRGKRIDTRNTHGTGCTLSSAIASNLARGLSLADAVGEAKAYISGCLAAGLDLGAGSGPMDHGWMAYKHP